MTTPSGVPPWVRTVAVADYGGDAQKTDYLGIGAINPKTDITSAQFLRLVADAVAAVRAVEFCTIQFTCRDATSEAPLVKSVTGMLWHYFSTSGYNGGTPPTGYPTVTRIGTGHVRVTFASSYTDEFGVSGDFTIHCVSGGAVGDASINTSCIRVSDLVADAYVYDTSTGTVTADQSGTIKVW